MGLFDFGGSKQSSSSQSTSRSSSFDNLDRLAFNLGLNRSQSSSFGQSSSAASSFGVSGSDARSRARSGGSSRSLSSQDVFGADTFRSLFGQAEGAAAGVDPGQISDAASLLFSSGTGFLESLGQGGEGASFLRDRINDPGIGDARVDQLRADVTEFLEEGAFRAAKSSGVAAGTFGGDRTRVQLNEALEQGADAIARGSVDIRSAEQDARDRAAGLLAQDETARSVAGLGGASDLIGLAETGALASFAPLGAFSSVIGPATALTQAGSVGSQFGASDSISSSFGRQGSQSVSQSLQRALSDAFGFDFGFDETTGRAGSSSFSQSTSESKGKSASFGFGSLFG